MENGQLEDQKWEDKKMDHKDIGCEDRRWMGLSQVHVQWQVLVVAVFSLLVLLTEK